MLRLLRPGGMVGSAMPALPARRLSFRMLLGAPADYRPVCAVKLHNHPHVHAIIEIERNLVGLAVHRDQVVIVPSPELLSHFSLNGRSVRSGPLIADLSRCARHRSKR